MITRHGQFIFSLCLVIGVVLLLVYLRHEQSIDEPSQIESPVKPVVFTPPVITPEPDPPKPATVEKPIEEPKKAPEVKEAKVKEVKKQEMKPQVRTLTYKAEKQEGKGSGSGDEKGFPSFWCEDVSDAGVLLVGLNKIGVNELIILNGKEVIGTIALSSKGLAGFQKKAPSSTGGFQRLLSDSEIETLAIPQIVAKAGQHGNDIKAGFYLPEGIVKTSLILYLASHSLDTSPEALDGFKCRYSKAGFEVTEVYN